MIYRHVGSAYKISSVSRFGLALAALGSYDVKVLKKLSQKHEKHSISIFGFFSFFFSRDQQTKQKKMSQKNHLASTLVKVD